MHFNVLNRKVHYWAAFATAVPLLVIIVTGLLLQMKKHWTWVQPAEQRGTGTAPVLLLEGVLAAVRGVPELKVSGWKDVNRIDLRPGRGVAKVWLNSGWEAQVDLGTGAVMHVAYRRSDLIESIHGLGGLWMGWVPYHAKRERRRSSRSVRVPNPQQQGRAQSAS